MSLLRPSRRALLYSLSSLALGYTTGTYLTHLLVPPALPRHGTPQDALLVSDLNNRLDAEFKVKVLRGKCLGVSRALKNASTAGDSINKNNNRAAASNERPSPEQEGWVEIVHPLSDTSSSSSAESGTEVGNGGTLLATLRGARNLGAERIFYDRGAHSLVAVVHFGPDLSGWPGVTHGGVLATVLGEKIALADALAHGGGGGGGGGEGGSASAVSEAARPQRLPGVGEHAKLARPPLDRLGEVRVLSLDYVRPTFANGFYVVRVAPSGGDDAEGALDVRMPVVDRGWTATLETMDARVCVKVAARMAGRSGTERVREKLAGAARGGYEEFREWMWPSRQKESWSG